MAATPAALPSEPPPRHPANRCRSCGHFVGEGWTGCDSDRMSKRAAALYCDRCTSRDLAPDAGRIEP